MFGEFFCVDMVVLMVHLLYHLKCCTAADYDYLSRLHMNYVYKQ